MSEIPTAKEVVLGLVQVINGDAPRSAAEEYLDAQVIIHMDEAKHSGVRIWYKWIHLIRNCGGIRGLRMIPCEVRWDPGEPESVLLSVRWSGEVKPARGSRASSAICQFKYKVRMGRIVEIWTSKVNYVFIFGRWIQYSACYKMFLGWALLYFAVMSLRGQDFMADRREHAPERATHGR